MNINELYLETHVRGEPHPTIEWVKDGVTISRDDPKYQQFDHADGQCELVVNDPTEKDSGKYVCQASNRCGNAEIPHYVLYEGKAAHIAENIHGVFHSDHSRVDRAKNDRIIPAHGTSENGDAVAEEDDKSKKNAKGRGRGGRSETPTAASTTPSAPTAPAKKEPRDQRITIHFPTKLSNRVAAEGTKVKLTCYLEGADPAIRWLKDEQPVVYSPKCRQNNNNGLCILEMSSVSVADTGVYKCYARNTSGEASTSANLEVYASDVSADLAPTFTRGMKELYNSKINEINITCHVRGMPTPTITWSKDGVTIEPSEKYQLIEHDDGLCELNISDCTRQDNGKYVCQADNRAGKAETTHIVQVQLREQRSSLVSLKDLPPTPTNGEATENGDSEEKPPSGPAGAKGKGQPRKKAEASSGGGGRRQAAPPPNPKEQLFFSAFLTDRTVAEGSKVTKLSCYIEGPDPQVRWFKDEQPLVMSPRCRAELKDGLVVLTLQSAVPDDSGIYRILARNQASEITSSCRLNVYETIKAASSAPIFTSTIKGMAMCSIVPCLRLFCFVFNVFVSQQSHVTFISHYCDDRKVNRFNSNAVAILMQTFFAYIIGTVREHPKKCIH